MPDKEYTKGKKAAAKAIVNSIARHKLQADQKKIEDIQPGEIIKYNAAKRELSDKKGENIKNLVLASKETKNISVKISDEITGEKSIEAEFEKDGNMSLHYPKGRDSIIDTNIDGPGHKIEKGENSKFYKKSTGHNLDKDSDKLKNKIKKEYNLIENDIPEGDYMKDEQCYLSLFEEAILESTNSKRKKLLLKSIKFLPDEVLDRNFPDMKERSHSDKVSALKRKIVNLPEDKLNKLLNSDAMSKLEADIKSSKTKLKKAGLITGGSTAGVGGAISGASYAGLVGLGTAASGIEILGPIIVLMYSGIIGAAIAGIGAIGATTTGLASEIINSSRKNKYLKSHSDEIISFLKDEEVLKESEFSDDLTAMYPEFSENKIRKISLDDAINSNVCCSDILKIMNNIKYGFISKKDGAKILNRDWIHNCRNLNDYYEVQKDPEVTIREKLGICTDQCLALKYLFNKYHPSYKTQMYALLKGRFGHCVFAYSNPEDNKWYYVESAWDKERGYHGAFDNQNAVEEYLKGLYNKHHSLDTNDPAEIMKYEDYLSQKEQLNESFLNEILRWE